MSGQARTRGLREGCCKKGRSAVQSIIDILIIDNPCRNENSTRFLPLHFKSCWPWPDAPGSPGYRRGRPACGHEARPAAPALLPADGGRPQTGTLGGRETRGPVARGAGQEGLKGGPCLRRSMHGYCGSILRISARRTVKKLYNSFATASAMKKVSSHDCGFGWTCLRTWRFPFHASITIFSQSSALRHNVWKAHQLSLFWKAGRHGLERSFPAVC